VRKTKYDNSFSGLPYRIRPIERFLQVIIEEVFAGEKERRFVAEKSRRLSVMREETTQPSFVKIVAEDEEKTWNIHAFNSRSGENADRIEGRVLRRRYRQYMEMK
jgi:hypothetical protein